MELSFAPQARCESADAARFYEEAQPGLGRAFLVEAEAGISMILDAPFRWRVVHGKFRRYLLKRFPYAIIYTVKDDEVYVIAFMHLSRKPDYWLGRGAK
ncbi:MAG: type II toxin-antitoxin system RelE/ParE family toxin [Chthoniobacteraceae bacterium]